MKKVYEYYLMDTGFLIKEAALEAKRDLGTTGDPYKLGYLMAMHTIVSLLQQQADTFQIPRQKLKLDDIDPEKDLL